MTYVSPGFTPDVIKEEDYIFGAQKLPTEILNESGDWTSHLPKLEVQRKKFDTFSCVSFANNNVCETIHKLRYGNEVNYSDRFTSVISETVPGRGNSHSKVAQAKHDKGAVLEEEYPFTDTMTQSEFYKPIDQNILDSGLRWVVEFEYGYERVNRSDFKEALKYSPLQVAVDSRTNQYKDFKALDHSVMLYALKDKAYIFDSYLNRFIEYSVNYPFGFGMRHHYKRKITLKLNDMTLKLIKGADKPEIYLLDFDNVLHHVEEMPDLKEIFGETAEWETLPQAEVDAMPEGVSLSSRKINFIESLKEQIKKLGVNI
jgi:hypothetical protein